MASAIIINQVKHKQASVNTKFHCLYGYYWQGQTMSMLAKLYGKNYSTISNWIERFEAEGSLDRKKMETI